ncbi:MAG: hypothetical protein KDC85_07800 [Saprospiraceae bacterium]|nr:hypothetical protein [Saprospiraceae bacterium]MCB9326566.1 hypothetical protein [Lewinellaceae bacterium]
MRRIFPIVLFLFLGLTFFACNNSADNATDAQATTPVVTTPAGNNPAPANTTAASGVEHYTCPNGHVGSGGEAPGNCAQCGTELDHNQAFHNAPAAQNPNSTATSPVFQNTQQPTQDSSPAQNARGDWHYLCSNGCAGGAGAKGNCAKCGSALAHNQTYHD